jgi:hypothetical protein
MPREADLLPDWFVGGAGKRRLLRALTDASSPLWQEGPPWTDVQLAGQAELTTKNAVGRHLRVLEAAGLLQMVAGGWQRTTAPLWADLKLYLDALDGLPSTALPTSRGGVRAGNTAD